METKEHEEKNTPSNGQVSIGAQQAESLDKLSKDPYFLYLVQTEVEARTRAQLGWWWKIIGGTLGVIIAAMTFIGYREYSNIEARKTELEKSITEAKESAAKAKDDIGKAKDEIDEDVRATKSGADVVRDKQNEAQRSVADAQNVSQHLIAEETTQIQSLVDRLFKNYEAIQSDFVTQNRKTLDENRKATEDGQNYLQTLQQKADELDIKEEELDKKIKDAKAKADEITSKSEQAKRLEHMEDTLKRARVFEFVFLESRDIKTVKVDNPYDPNNPFMIRFKSNGLGAKSINLAVQLNGQSEQPEYAVDLYNRQNVIGAENVGLVFEVVAVYHRKLAPDFAMLKIYYKHQPDKSESQAAVQQSAQK